MRFLAMLAVLLLGGCDTEGDKAAAASHGTDVREQAAASARPAVPSASSVVQALSPEEDAKLRRKFALAELKYNPCIKLKDDVVQGRGCPSAIAVFGPYANVPGNSELELTFDIQSPTTIDVYSDMGSEGGKRELAALINQTLAPKEKRHFGYKVNMAQPDTAVEARIWVHGAGPVDFDITNLSVTVR
jgi:hypothetical protein